MSETRPNYYRARMRVTSVASATSEASAQAGMRMSNTAEVECFDAIEALGFDKNFNLGNVLKYLWRAGRKTPDALADLKKALTYLDREIWQREQEATEIERRAAQAQGGGR